MTDTPTHRHPLVRAGLSQSEPDEWTLGSAYEPVPVDDGNIKDWLNDVYNVLKEAVASPASRAPLHVPDKTNEMFYSLPFKQAYLDEIAAMKSIESLATARADPVASREEQDDALIDNVDDIAFDRLLRQLGDSLK